jgi:cell wall assembly regulator SMI1
MKPLQETWKTFSPGQIANLLNSPCSIGDINDVETCLGFLLPKQLNELLMLNNGQSKNSEGIFKNIAG